MGKEHESLAAQHLILYGFALCVFGVQGAGTGQAVVEQIMVPGSRAERMGGIALFPAELVQSQIDKIFTWKNGKDHFAHKSPHLAFLFGKSICFPLFSAISFLNQVIMNKKRLKNIIYQNAS
jgi:hypothetical protein